MTLLLTISIMLSIIVLFLNHPLSMGYKSFYIFKILIFLDLLLIYLGGMLVLFMYVTSLASNEMFIYSNNIFLTITSLPIILSLMYYLKFNFSMNLHEKM